MAGKVTDDRLLSPPATAVEFGTTAVADEVAAPAGVHRLHSAAMLAELLAVPAIRLDAAFVHLNLGDRHGNAAYTGIDPYFDDLFLMAADRRYLSVERVLPTAELVKAVAPQALLVNRMMVDAIVEAPNGAHFTTNAPDYGRDESFQRHYAEAAAEEDSWAEFVGTYLSGSEADYQAAVRRFADRVRS